MTVSRGAAGKVMLVLNSNIWRRSTMKTNIWCWEYLSNIEMDTVCTVIKIIRDDGGVDVDTHKDHHDQGSGQVGGG